jgi:peptide/nickel transport system substrate-binding protein
VASVVQKDIASMKVVDDLTMEFTLNDPQVRFDGVLLTSALNWVAKPEALRQGTEAFDKEPVGAGPFKLKSWHRGGTIELVRNENYFDAPKPYLDGMTITTVPDANQRVDSLIAGNADLVPASNPAARVKGADAGMQVHEHPINGGNIVLLNSTIPPFDDIRAREAVVKAVDQEALNAATAQGKGEIVESIFHAEDPLYSGTRIQEHDPERAQELFDELAAEGKPVKFTIAAALNPEIAEAVQTQLSSFKNVTVKVQKVEAADSTAKLLEASYQALTNGAPFAVADNTLYTWFHPDSAIHPGRPDNPELAKLIQRGRATTNEAERKEIWQQVEQMTAESYAMIWTIRPERAYLAATDVGGFDSYGAGSATVADLWLAK